MLESTLTKTVKEMVTEDFRTAAVFEKYAIDFCCGGKKTLQAACQEKGIDPAALVQDLEGAGLGRDATALRFSYWELDTLAGFIVDNHHAYVRESVPTLLAHTQKIATVHGRNHPELFTIAERFREVADELMGHMMKEERILFPYIEQLAVARREGSAPPVARFGTIQNPIRMMEAEHQSAGDGVHVIREVSKGYQLPSDACTTYRVTYRELEEFERDLHQHIHLENNILFPKAIDLEARLRDAR